MGVVVSAFLFQPPSPPYSHYTLPHCTLQTIKTLKKYPNGPPPSQKIQNHHAQEEKRNQDQSKKLKKSTELKDSNSSSTSSTTSSKSSKSKSNGPPVMKIPIIFLEQKDSKLCILFSHGNATNISQMYPFLQLLHQSLHINVCAYEYVGYSAVSGNMKSSEIRVYQSIEAGVQFLNGKGFNNDQIVLFGTSLGSGPSVYMASNAKFHALILQSPFTSVIKTKISSLNLKWMDMFLNYEKAPYIKCRTFFIHGKKDDLVPPDHTKQLYALLPTQFRNDPIFVDGAGHNNILQKYTIPKYVSAISKFLYQQDGDPDIHLSQEEIRRMSIDEKLVAR